MQAIWAALTGAAAAVFLYPAALWCRKFLLQKRQLDISRSRFEKIVLPIATGIVGGIFGYFMGFHWQLLYSLLILTDALVIGMIDYQHRIIPNETILALPLLTLLFGLPGLVSFQIWSSLSGFAGCLVLFLLPSLFGKKVGSGDVKLAAAVGFTAGLTGSLCAIVIMGVLMTGYLIADRRTMLTIRVKQYVPMGPFIATALVTVQVAMAVISF